MSRRSLSAFVGMLAITLLLPWQPRHSPRAVVALRVR